MSEWISADDELPESTNGKWSKPVMAMCDKGFVYRVSYFKGSYGGCWQRPMSFVDNESSFVVCWMHITDDED